MNENEKDVYIIYKHTNKINGKVYIGQTKQEPERRWQNGLSAYRHNAHFLLAIKKYGWENFEHEILLENLTLEEMKYWEDYYIEFYEARNPEKGYNLEKGGIPSPFVELWKDPEFKEKMSKQQSELMKERLKDPQAREQLRQISIQNWEDHPERREEYSKRMTEWLKEKWLNPEYKEKMSQYMKDRWKDEEYKNKMIEHNKENAKNNWKNPEYRKKMCKAVINIETGLVFESGAAAGRWCGIDRSCITRALKSGKASGKHPETKEPLHWRYAKEGGEL